MAEKSTLCTFAKKICFQKYKNFQKKSFLSLFPVLGTCSSIKGLFGSSWRGRGHFDQWRLSVNSPSTRLTPQHNYHNSFSHHVQHHKNSSTKNVTELLSTIFVCLIFITIFHANLFPLLWVGWYCCIDAIAIVPTVSQNCDDWPSCVERGQRGPRYRATDSLMSARYKHHPSTRHCTIPPGATGPTLITH